MILIYRVAADDTFNNRTEVFQNVTHLYKGVNKEGLLVAEITLKNGTEWTFGPNYFPGEMDMEFSLVTDSGYIISSENL